MKKSILISVLVVTVIISFSLVSLAAENWGNINWKQFAGTELNFLCYASGTTDLFKEPIADFEKMSGIKVHFVQLVDSQRKKVMLTDYALGTADYDLGSIGISNREEFAAPGYLEPLEPYLNNPNLTDLEWYNLDGFSKDVLAAGYSKAGDLVYIPWTAQYYLLYYLKDVFDKLGLTLPKTWEEYEQVTKALDEARKDGKIDSYAYVDRALPGSGEGGWSMFCSASRYGLNLVDFDNMISNMNTPKGIEFMEFYTGWSKKYAPLGSSNWTWPDIAEAFSNGLLAMAIAGNTSWKAIEDPEKSTVAGNVGYAPTIMKNGGKDPLWEWGWCINKDSSKKEAAWLLIEFLTSPNTDQRFGAIFGAPARVASYQTPEYKEAMPSQEFIDAQLWMMGNGIDPSPQIANIKYAEAADIISREMNNVVAGIKDVETACADADAALEKIGITPAEK
ncbi:MAG: extracellular solute-binding protein [Bacteroidetes bacterium]|nr:extracellular solute-binding protein [Bacteroidota bacterium]